MCLLITVLATADEARRFPLLQMGAQKEKTECISVPAPVEFRMRC